LKKGVARFPKRKPTNQTLRMALHSQLKAVSLSSPPRLSKDSLRNLLKLSRDVFGYVVE